MKKCLLILTFLVLLLHACVSVHVASNKATWYDKKLSKVFILVNGAKEAKRYSADLVSGLQKSFTLYGISTAFYIRDPLALETDEDVDAKINKFSPNEMMMIRQTSVHSTNGRIDGGNFEISLVEGDSKKIFWKGVLDVTGSMGLETASSQSIDKLIEKLKLDGLL